MTPTALWLGVIDESLLCEKKVKKKKKQPRAAKMFNHNYERYQGDKIEYLGEKM